MKKTILISFIHSFILLISTTTSFSQETIVSLWPDKIPNQQITDEVETIESTGIIRISKVQTPSFEVFLPAKNNASGQAVLICPGGGYEFSLGRNRAHVASWTDLFCTWINSLEK